MWPAATRLFPKIEPEIGEWLMRIPPGPKQLVLGAYYAVAIEQRDMAHGDLANWSLDKAPDMPDTELWTLSCESDRLPLFRMVTSFLRYVGSPAKVRVVSDGSISPATDSALRALTDRLEVVPWQGVLGPWTPSAIATLAERTHSGRKLALLVAMSERDPGTKRLYVDSDIEFFRGGRRLRELISAMELGDPPYYMHDTYLSYDERVLARVGEITPHINAGMVLTASPLNWRIADDAFDPHWDPPFNFVEQTAVAAVLSAAGARPFSKGDYRIYWRDRRLPWDALARKDIVCRHYTALLKWKMWLKGGPRGRKTLLTALRRSVSKPPRPAAST
jgi:hypothetical protein